MKANEILTKAAQHLAERAKTYDRPEGERSMGKTVQMFNALTDGEITEEQGWLFMAILKMVRSQQGDYKADNYEDGAAYFALAGERTTGGMTEAQAEPPKQLKVPTELQFEARCIRSQTRRQQLIAAGIPAHEFYGINDPRLDEPADETASTSLRAAFNWSDTPQGAEHWENWYKLLN